MRAFVLLALFFFAPPELFAQETQEIFLRSDWLIDVASPATSIWSGGNESSGSTNDSPHSANGISLAHSVIGTITAQSAGYPNAANDLAALGNASRLAGNAYKYTNYGFGPVPIPAVAWIIVFPGGFNPAAPLGSSPIYAANVPSTYISGDIAQTDYYLRARLEVNPGDTDAAQQLVLLVDDQIAPLEWSGTEAIAYSAYARAVPGPVVENGTNVETSAVEEARGYFLGACTVFAQFLANPYNATLVEGQNPLLSAAVTNQVAQVLDDYLRNLSAYAQASLTDFQLRSLASFYDPANPGSPPSQALLNDIDNTGSQIQMLLLLASPFRNPTVYTAAAAGQITSFLPDLGRLHRPRAGHFQFGGERQSQRQSFVELRGIYDIVRAVFHRPRQPGKFQL